MSEKLNIPKINNRSEKRRCSKALRKSGRTKAEADKIVKVFSDYTKKANNDISSKYKTFLLEGEKVKLNVEQIKSHPDYPILIPKYREFIESNTDTIFTVEYDKKDKEKEDIKPTLVCLQESEMKWFFWHGDLLVLDKKDGKFKEMLNIVLDESEVE